MRIRLEIKAGRWAVAALLVLTAGCAADSAAGSGGSDVDLGAEDSSGSIDTPPRPEIAADVPASGDDAPLASDSAEGSDAAEPPDAAVPHDAAVPPDEGPDLDVADVPSLPPTDADGLVAWLTDRKYAEWPAEAAPHASTGPHFGTVRTFIHPTLDATLGKGGVHAVGSASVKELYGKGDTVIGWSVMVKTQAEGGGNAWYWFEKYNESTYASSQGASLCTGCHSAGQDFVLTPWPQP